MKKGKIFFIIVAVIIIIAMALSVPYIFPKEQVKDDTDPNGNIAPEVTSINKLNAELINIEEYNGIVKIDLITPGLDTYGLKVMLYDMNGEAILSETDIGEGTWSSGLTDNGFYVVDQQAKKLTVYNREGKEKFKKTFDTKENWSPACGLSRDEKRFGFITLLSGNAYIADLSDDTTKLVGTKMFANDFVGVKNDEFYFKSIDGGLMVMTEENCGNAVVDNRISLFTPELCVGYGNYNFVTILNDTNELKYVPIDSVDQMVVGVGNKWFATSISKENNSIIKNYDLEKGRYSVIDIDGPVRDLIYTDDGDILAVVGESDNSKLLVYNVDSFEYKTFSFESDDAPIHASESFDTPAANTAYTDKLIKNVPLIHQFPEFPTGCESVSAVMALKYYGENITVTKFVNEFLPKSREFYYSDGKNYGPDPYRYFIGDPKSAASYGCMAPVIETALKGYFEDDSRVVNSSGKTLAELCSEYIDNDVPVLVWATIGMLETKPVNSWYLSSGKRFTWPGNEHCMLLVGYDKNNYYFNDPYSGKCISYEKSLCEDRHAELGTQSVVILSE